MENSNNPNDHKHQDFVWLKINTYDFITIYVQVHFNQKVLFLPPILKNVYRFIFRIEKIIVLFV